MNTAANTTATPLATVTAAEAEAVTGFMTDLSGAVSRLSLVARTHSSRPQHAWFTPVQTNLDNKLRQAWNMADGSAAWNVRSLMMTAESAARFLADYDTKEARRSEGGAPSRAAEFYALHAEATGAAAAAVTYLRALEMRTAAK